MTLTRDQARAAFKAAGLRIEDLAGMHFKDLEVRIDAEMQTERYMGGSLRMEQRKGDRQLRCKSFYFENREAVSFNKDGFIGFAGWADEVNVQPILRGFMSWVTAIGPVFGIKTGYYVNVRDDEGRDYRMRGPYDTHQAALDAVVPVSREVNQIDPRAAFWAWGTCKMEGTTLPLGRLGGAS